MSYRTAVILVNYKGAQDTEACLHSLYASDVVPHIVVVDNTPHDPCLTEVMLGFPDVRLIIASENLGFGNGNNIGINYALSKTDCEFVFILNNDAIVEPDTIGKLENALDVNHEIGLVTPRIVFMDDPKVLWYGGGEVSWLRGSVVGHGYFGPSDAPLALQARNVSFASGCAILFRRNVMAKLGGFDERFFMYEEDVELCLRAQELGWKIWYEPSAIVHHKVQSSLSGNHGYVDMLSAKNRNLTFYLFHVVRNRLLNMRIHAKGRNRLIFSFGFPVYLLKKIFVYGLHKRWDAIVTIYRAWRSYRKCIGEGAG